ncbi:MAG: alanine dehydrogenase [Chitinophagaceae bacterium]|nr:MAG: alanine dehydrogenase [Chitinophagaceae bacterium]
MFEEKPSDPQNQQKENIDVQEKPKLKSRNMQSLFIGIPRETAFQESRISLTPDAVKLLVNNGHRVLIESKAGEGAHFYDNEYMEAGGEIVFSKEKVYEAEVILKVAPPSEKDIEYLKMNQILITPIHLPTLKKECVLKLMQKKVTTLALEYVKDDSGFFPFVRSMSEIAGSSVMLIAAEILSGKPHGKGVLLGGISGVLPAKVVILGAGVVGEFAARTALGLGAEVRVFDNNIYKLMRMQNNIASRISTSTIVPEVLTEEIKNADVVVGAVHSEHGRSPMLVTEQMVSKMKAGSVIIDVSIDQGGCFETSDVTSHNNPTFKKYDVVHYCVPNIPSRVGRTASYALSNILGPNILMKASEYGGFEKMLQVDRHLRNGVYVYRGRLTNQHIGNLFDLNFTHLDLLFMSNM